MCLRHYDFVLVSDFDIRISYFRSEALSMTSFKPLLDTGNPGLLVPMTQKTNHTQKKPRQIRIVCPIKKNFQG